MSEQQVSTNHSPYGLFEAFGIELEYMVANRNDLTVAPVVDRLISSMCGDPNGHPTLNNATADNELSAHVLEIKCAQPIQNLPAQCADFMWFIQDSNRRLNEMGCQLLPTGMHPFMEPYSEAVIWPHEDSEIYKTYDRIFDCRGHGWSNLQSVHLNLPFRGDAEFMHLHNAISLLLPLLPAMCASSPFYEGRKHGWLDGRLYHYVLNQASIPEIIGPIVPEPVLSEQEYRERIHYPITQAMASHDPEGILEADWLNSRAAIARFDRGTIEIRCMDTQETPFADLALCHLCIMAIYRLVQVGQAPALHSGVPSGLLRKLFLDTAKQGSRVRLPNLYPVEAFGLQTRPDTVQGFWEALVQSLFTGDTSQATQTFYPAIDHILRNGNLAQRILRACPSVESQPTPKGHREILDAYGHLAGCLDRGEMA